MTNLSGKHRGSVLEKAIDREQKLQADPNIRADRMINLWQDLKEQHRKLPSWGARQETEKIESEMRKVADQITKDPQMEAILKSRATELGINHLPQGQKLDQTMMKQLSRGIER